MKNTFFLDLTAKELKHNLKLVNENKAMEINSFPSKILKNCRKVMSQPPKDLLHLIFQRRMFPDAFNIAKVLPLHKKIII